MAASTIVREDVRLRKVDLVALGTHGRISIFDVCLGSTANGMRKVLPCDAFVL
jgi:nucleotide-binding universal stress UspA family protein